jgi:hypothetical protein
LLGYQGSGPFVCFFLSSRCRVALLVPQLLGRSLTRCSTNHPPSPFPDMAKLGYLSGCGAHLLAQRLRPSRLALP